MNDIIEPSWSVFGPCSRCGAADGAPCADLRSVRFGGVLRINPPLLHNPHKGRQQVRN